MDASKLSIKAIANSLLCTYKMISKFFSDSSDMYVYSSVIFRRQSFPHLFEDFNSAKNFSRLTDK